MGIEAILSELNEQQKIAACMANNHALILAGAGSGKTKTIIARAAYLISSGTPAHRIHILTFTRRSASSRGCCSGVKGLNISYLVHFVDPKGTKGIWM